MSDRINCRNCIHFNDSEHRCCLNDGSTIKKECYFTLSKRKPKGKDIVIENLKTKIADLEAKLAEKESEVKVGEFWHSAYQGKQKEYDMVYAELRKSYDEVEQLKQQLAEKDNEIERLQEDCYRRLPYEDCQEFESFIRQSERRSINHDKLNFAIKVLETVKDYFVEEYEDENGYKTNDRTMTKDVCEVADYIDNQIKQLKEK